VNEFFRNTLGPAGWIAAGLVPPAILALYFLKLKRQPLEVPSTYLWTKVIEDLHVNSLWQRFRRNLLLLLQLAVALLAILALLRPGWRGQSLSGKQFIFLVDRSASMSTRDVDGGSRLDSAKQRVRELIDLLDSDMSAMLIAFDDEPEVLQEFTDNRRQLREALDRIRPTNRSTGVRGALELASGFANPNRVTIEEGGAEVDAAPQEEVELMIVSDGRFPSVEGFSLGNLQAQYLPVGDAATPNLALTTLSVSRNPLAASRRQVFVQAANFGEEQANATVELRLNGEVLDAVQLTVPAGDVAGTTVDLGDAKSGRLEARLSAAGGVHDALALDDTAYATLDPPRQTRVLLVTPGNRALELGMSTVSVKKLATVETVAPQALATPALVQSLQTEQFDLVIYDQCGPEKPADMPAANTLFVGRLPPLDGWRERSSDKPLPAPQIIDWQRSHPLLSLVEFGNVAVVESYAVEPPLGGTVLVDSSRGPLLAVAPRRGFEDAVLGFEIVSRDAAGDVVVNTNWPRMHSFPNFCLNVVDYLAGASVFAEVDVNRPGRPVEVELPERATNPAAVLPDGQRRPLKSVEARRVQFAETDQLGFYRIESDGAPAATFAVNLFDLNESDVRLRTAVDAGGVRRVDRLTLGHTQVAAAASAPARKELWPWLLGAALVILTLEWYIYNRRVYV
jgi:hypothetical protein